MKKVGVVQLTSKNPRSLDRRLPSWQAVRLPKIQENKKHLTGIINNHTIEGNSNPPCRKLRREGARDARTASPWVGVRAVNSQGTAVPTP